MTADTGQPTVPTRYLGICDFCRNIKSFATERERDLWEKFHPHEDGTA